MIVGFTGTRQGMTEEQKKALDEKLANLQGKETFLEFHHGCASGADTEAHQIAKRRKLYLVARPAFDEQLKAFDSSDFSEIEKPLKPLIRNRAIVMACHLLIAAPAGDVEELRSGTWATVRYARAAEVRILILWPNGHIQYE